ncbi:MAG: lysozyme inhibitor LprI family protein, partial [Synergistaceae bacterium]|nr:lysozyme inhibitor LprI family protein [Synergistaceae bacterium]
MKGTMTGRGMVLALLLLFALSGALSASGGEEIYDVPRSGFLTGTYVNLREKPSTEGKIVGQLPSKDEAGELLVTAAFDGGEEFPWYRVSSAKFGEGWIYGKFLSLQEASEAIHPIDAEINRCVDKSPSTHGMMECTTKGMEKWDRELNRLYKELMTVLPKEGQTALRTAQRAWIPLRDSEFALSSEVYSTIYTVLDGGTMWLVNDAIAHMEVVRRRTLELDQLLKTVKKGSFSLPGDLSKKTMKEYGDMTFKMEYLSALLGKKLGEKGNKISAEALSAWKKYRDENIVLLSLLYGGKEKEEVRAHFGLQMDKERLSNLETLLEDMRAGGMEVSEIGKKNETPPPEKTRENKEPYKGDRSLYHPVEGKCDFSAYIIDPDPKGTNVRDVPGGAVITVIPHRPENPDIITVKVTGHKKGWFSVVLHDGKKGWIFGKMLGVSVRNYTPDSVTALRCR